jgi:hypothetical protein
VVSRHGSQDCIELVQPFVYLHEVENPLLEVFEHADLHCMEEVGLREGAHDAGNMSKLVESSVNMAQQDFGIGCLGIRSAQSSI